MGTIAGLAMVGGGIYGVVQDVSDDDDDTTVSTPAFPTFPSVATTETPGVPDQCLQVRGRDIRLGLTESIEFEGKGSAEVNPVCNGSTLVLFFQLTGTGTKDVASYPVWLYKNRKRAKQIGSLIGSDGRASGSATIPPEINTRRYDEIVISRIGFGETERRPRKIVLRGSL